MIFDSPVVPKGSLILMTGETGYIASHTTEQLIKDGYQTRGTIHDKSSAFNGLYGSGQFDVVEVPDMIVDGAFDEAVKAERLTGQYDCSHELETDVL
ncbi:hypothetical protein LTR17_011653 [Elasticomyces elasticus]|nr:hypothetical protein LTR17_011653 [Elasticomyces elasticus]